MNNFILKTLKTNAGFNIESQFLYAGINEIFQNKDKHPPRVLEEKIEDAVETIDSIISDLDIIKSNIQLLNKSE